MDDAFPNNLTFTNHNSTDEIDADSRLFSVSTTHQKWLKTNFELSSQKDIIYQTYTDLVSARKFGLAVDFMLNEVYEHSKILAQKFEVELEDITEISSMLEQLKDDAIITEEEWNRFTILQMVLDGLDIEIYEYGAEISPDELSCLTEFLDLVKKILERNCTYVEISSGNLFHFDSLTFQGIIAVFEKAPPSFAGTNPSTVYVVNYIFSNEVSERRSSVAVTNFQAS